MMACHVEIRETKRRSRSMGANAIRLPSLTAFFFFFLKKKKKARVVVERRATKKKKKKHFSSNYICTEIHTVFFY